jgi:hypothetical protein
LSANSFIILAFIPSPEDVNIFQFKTQINCLLNLEDLLSGSSVVVPVFLFGFFGLSTFFVDSTAPLPSSSPGRRFLNYIGKNYLCIFLFKPFRNRLASQGE